MIRTMWSAAVMCAMIGCSRGPTEAVSPPGGDLAPDAFIGAWRSVTPSLDFIGLSVVSKSSEMGVLGTRLTLSGVAWEGGGRIDGDSLVVNMSAAGTMTPTGVVVVRVNDLQTLRAQVRSANAAPFDLTFVRENRE